MEQTSSEKIGLVVLNYNDYQTTLQFLNLTENISLIGHIVVVDNHSTDNSFEILKRREDSKITVISTERNAGYAAGNNVGISELRKKISPTYIIIANPDVTFDEEFIMETLTCFYQKKDAAAVSGVMISNANFNNPKIAWKRPAYTDLILSNLLILRRIIGDRTNYGNEYLKSERFVKVDAIPGSLFIVKNEDLQRVEDLDEDTFLYEEENILSYRLYDIGKAIYLASNVTYHHNHSISINKSIPNVGKRLDIDFESRMIYADKYLKISKIKRMFLKLTYRIGKFNYLICLRLIHWKR